MTPHTPHTHSSPFCHLKRGVVPLVHSVPHKYYLIQQGKTWNEAQAYCRATHTDLAIIRNNDDMVQLQNETQRQQFSSTAWIGLYNPINSWRWSMGNEPLGTKKWGSGEPNNAGGHEECAVMTPWGLADVICTLPLPFVCFDEITGQQQIVRVKVQSNEDVNETAVKAAILEQLKKFLLPVKMLFNFYTAIMESILTSSITVWFAAATAGEKAKLQRVIHSAEKYPPPYGAAPDAPTPPPSPENPSDQGNPERSEEHGEATRGGSEEQGKASGGSEVQGEAGGGSEEPGEVSGRSEEQSEANGGRDGHDGKAGGSQTTSTAEQKRRATSTAEQGGRATSPPSSRTERRPPPSSSTERRPLTRSRDERRPQPGWAEGPHREGGREVWPAISSAYEE
ncbi:hypothetical protein QTP86_026732 [Hemibagrus guttatus]|nr:hypothetical protein QTP86_026732 [Hemibagrus guttatus]